MENQKERRLRLWKERQEAEGHDVSGVTTLEQAEHFFDKKEPVEVPEIPEVTEEPVEVPAEEPEKTEKPKKQRAKKPKEV